MLTTMRNAISGLALVAGLGCAVPVSAQQGTWMGSVGSGCQVWHAAPAPGRTVSWSGVCSGGRASGPGTLVWHRDGRPTARYVGEMQDGRLHGRGVYEERDGPRAEGLYYRGRLVVPGSIKQGILMRASQVQPDAPGRSEGDECVVDLVASSIVPHVVDTLAGLLVIRRNGTLVRTMKFNLDRLAPNELRVASFSYLGCEKPAGPRDRHTFALWEISLCDVGGQPRSDCDRLITFEGQDDVADDPLLPQR